MAEVGITLLNIVIAVVMFAGMASLIMPGMPGLVVIWAAALIYGLLTGFEPWWVIVIYVLETLFMLGGNALDNILMGTGAAEMGAKWYVVVLVLIAGVVASIFTTPIGGILITFGLFFLVEFARLRDLKEAAGSTGAMAKGWGKSVVARMGVAAVMITGWVMIAVWA